LISELNAKQIVELLEDNEPAVILFLSICRLNRSSHWRRKCIFRCHF